VSCDTGTSQCREAGNAANGKDCGGGRICRGGECVVQKERGETCASSGECKSGTCVDGHCCNGGEKFCDGQCRDSGYCCSGQTRSCQNNCGTTGVATCQNGRPGACSVANTCCERDRNCTNNCGESGTRPCNGTSLGACSTPNRECCGQTRNCKDRGTRRECRDGRFVEVECAGTEACQGGNCVAFPCDTFGNCREIRDHQCVEKPRDTDCDSVFGGYCQDGRCLTPLRTGTRCDRDRQCLTNICSGSTKVCCAARCGGSTCNTADHVARSNGLAQAGQCCFANCPNGCDPDGGCIP
jgi:hypothetical protein